MAVLVVNAGSSSLKLSLVADGGTVIREQVVESWDGSDLGALSAFIGSGVEIAAVGHRVVHGGPRYRSSVVIDDEVVEYLDSIADFAPLHNPRAVSGIRAVGRLLDATPAVAVFDTAWHSTLPLEAATYALPREWNERFQLRRYGFHGISHAYAARRAAELDGKPLAELRMVTCHLGAGASLCAVRDGRSVDTTMGFTPLAGLVMQTRSGSVDPGLVLWLLEHGSLDLATVAHALEQESGLKGLSGTSGDLREVLAARRDGNQDAGLAFDVLTHRLAREIGAMSVSAGGMDVLVFTGGMGEHSPELRAATAHRLRHLGVDLDPRRDGAEGDREVSSSGATVRTYVIAAAEDVEVAREVGLLLVQ